MGHGGTHQLVTKLMFDRHVVDGGSHSLFGMLHRWPRKSRFFLGNL